MKAVVVKGIGEPKDVLVLSDMTDPPAPAQGQAIVRVRKRVVHPADYQAIRGILPGGMFASGGTPGIDGVGVVETVGADLDPATGIVPGTRVIFHAVRGTWAERIMLPATAMMQ